MAQPIWITPAGDLGRIAEGLYFSTPLVALDPAGNTVYYRLIAGALPDGIHITNSGLLEGVPGSVAKVGGVISTSGQDITTKFAVRAYTLNNGTVSKINDRTFNITVTGQGVLAFITPPGLLGTYYDGSVVSIPIEFISNDANNVVTVSLLSGQLPPGLTLLPTGKIVGYIEPRVKLTESATTGWDKDDTTWDEFSFDFFTNSNSSNKHYLFSLKITDGKHINVRDFSIYVIFKDSLTADNTEITVDNTFILADVTPVHKPVLKDFSSLTNHLGTFRHNNWFAYRFNALDFDNEALAFAVTPSDTGLPQGLSVNSTTGWFYGQIDDVGIIEVTYKFDIKVYRVNDPSVESEIYTFFITIIGDSTNRVVWVTPSYLGSIDTGAVSMFTIFAREKTGQNVKYRLKPGGIYQRLPQGLQLLESGNIVGRVTFNTFTLDTGTTTFDRILFTKHLTDETTFDMVYRFTAEAYTDDGSLVIDKTFTIKVNRAINGNLIEPYESVYINAMPSLSNRTIINTLLTNTDIIPRDLVYRIDDPEFGISTKVHYTQVFGVKIISLIKYIETLSYNHYKKTLILGEIKTAQALDDNGNIVYEVVYADIIDSAVNGSNLPDDSLTWPVPIEYNGTITTTVYPNSLLAMQNRIIDAVEQYKSILPLWMLSKQEDGQIPFFVKCWPIVYCKPGKSKQVLYNIQQKFGTQLNHIEFEIDRWILDGQLVKNWEPSEDPISSGGRWTSPELVTFDVSSTTFDENSLKFLSSVDLAGKTDRYDKYIMFPRTNILG